MEAGRKAPAVNAMSSLASASVRAARSYFGVTRFGGEADNVVAGANVALPTTALTWVLEHYRVDAGDFSLPT